MLKRYVSFLIVVFILFGSLSCADAHDGQEEHDEDLWGVLFGEGVYLPPDQEARFKAIADAAALCIDQFSVNETIKSKEGLFNELNHRIGFSFGFADIELQKGSTGMNVTARTHRHYTYRGWSFPEYPLKELWEQRKKILTATVNKEIFGYSLGILANLSFAEGILYKETAYNDECEAFCKLVYYIHILGDYEAAETYSAEFQQLIPLVRHEDPRNPALIDELISIVPILFKTSLKHTDCLSKN